MSPAENETNGEGWPGYRRLVLRELKRIDDNLLVVKEEVEAARRDIAALQIKAGIWGFAAGLLPSIAVLLIALLGHK